MFKGSQTLGPIVVLRPRRWLMGGIGCEIQVKVSWVVRGEGGVGCWSTRPTTPPSVLRPKVHLAGRDLKFY